MIGMLDPSAQAFLDALSQVQSRAQTAQTQLSTGLKINQVSDAPDQIGVLLQTKAAISQNDQIGQNLGIVKAQTDAAESALQSAVLLVQKAQTLASQGQGSIVTAATRTTIGQDLGAVLTSLVNLSNTAVSGHYVFSGDTDLTSPYTIDLSLANPIGAYAGAPSTRQVQTPDGTLISVSATAQQIFDGPTPGTNIFTSINSLRQAMLNNDQAGINAAMPLVTSAFTYLNQQHALYGATQNKVNDAIAEQQQLSTQLRTQLGGIQDADLTQAIVQLNQTSLQEQAALRSWAQIPRKSLFDFLA